MTFGKSGLKALEDSPWKTRISEPKRDGFSRWRGDDEARRAVYNNRARLLSGAAKAAFKLRVEFCERSFAHILDRGGMRRAWLRGRENIHKRYLIHVAGHNLGLLMRHLIGAGTPKQAMAKGWGLIIVLSADNAAPDQAAILIVVAANTPPTVIAILIAGDHHQP